MLRFPHFLGSRLTDGGKVVSPTHRPPFTPLGRFLILISVRGLVDPKAIVQLEGLSKLKKTNLIRTRSHNLPACSIVPQATMLLRAPVYCKCIQILLYVCHITVSFHTFPVRYSYSTRLHPHHLNSEDGGSRFL
jgi:hypothetical protein